MSRIPQDLRVFLAGLLLLLPFQLTRAAEQRWPGIDGGYYLEVARHVRDGEGLSTHVSLYNFGYPDFPHPTSVYPLWPWMLGMAGRLLPLDSLAFGLPVALYFSAVIAAFAFGRRAWPAPLAEGLPLHGGHLAAALLAFNRQFIAFSAMPYTEGVSWTLLFGYLWRLAGRPSGWRWGLETGLWMTLLFLGRAQFVLVPMAVFGAMGLRFVVGPDRRRVLGEGLAAGAVMALGLGAWWARLRGFLLDDGPLSLFRFDQNRVSDRLGDFDVIVPTHGPLDTLLDRLGGLRVAYDLSGDEGWHTSFAAAHWALPLALAFALRCWRPRSLVAWLRQPDGLLRATLLLLAVGGPLSIHLAHKHFNGEWYFHKRQGMIALIGFALPLAWLVAQRGWARLLAGGIVASCVAVGISDLVANVEWAMKEARGGDRYQNLIHWLEQARDAEGGELVVAMEEGDIQRVAWRTEGIGYHWLGWTSTYQDLRTMVDELGARYAIYNRIDREEWPMLRAGGRMEAEFRQLRGRPDGFVLLEPRDEPLPPPASRRVLLVGVEGLSWKILSPMIAAGELPAFKQLYADGASQVDLAAPDEAWPELWRQVATGRKEAGPAVWEVAAAQGRTVSVRWPGEVPVDPAGDAAADAAPFALAEVAALHLWGPAALQRRSWDAVEPWAFSRPKSGAAELAAIHAAYRAVDARLGALLSELGQDLLVLVSPRSSQACPSAEQPGCPGRSAKGVVFVHGPGVTPGARLRELSILDLAPTVAWVAGLPIAQDLPGRVISEAWAWEAAGAYGRSEVPSWGPGDGGGFDAAERLRGLGYGE